MLPKCSCGRKNIITIDAGFLVLFHYLWSWVFPLRRVSISKPSGGHSCPCFPHTPLPQALLGLFSLKFLQPRLRKCFPWLRAKSVPMLLSNQPLSRCQLQPGQRDERQHSGEGLLGCRQDHRLQPALRQESAKADGSLRVHTQQWKAHGVKGKSKCIRTPVLQFTSCAVLIKSVNLSGPQIIHLNNGMQKWSKSESHSAMSGSVTPWTVACQPPLS